MTGRPIKLVAILAGVLSLMAFPWGPLKGEPAYAALQRPNIIFVFSDDLDTPTFEKAMPKTKSLIGDKGVTFDNAFFSEPLCCPSRASMFRGQYPHNTRVTQNEYPAGGFRKFWEQGLANDTYATVLQTAGYRTFYAGKIMNGYGQSKMDGQTLKPILPGFDVFRGAVVGPGTNTWKFENGRIKSLPKSCKGKPERATCGLHDQIVTEWAQKFVTQSANGEEPFAAVVSLHSPHIPASYPKHYSGMYKNTPLPHPPSYNEADVSDKPPHMQLSPINGKEKADLKAFNRQRLRSSTFADDQIAKLVSTLKETGEWESTYFVFWTDNGYHMGQHRLEGQRMGGKSTPYLEDVRFPMLVSGPGIPAGVRRDEFISAVDLLPTFLDVAGAQVPDYADGRSFLPLARGEDVAWRDFAYSEMSAAAGTPERNWRAVYTKDEAYHEWTATGDKELYDLSRDPHELENLLSPGASASSFGTLAEKMATCSADACRRAENP